MEDAGDGPGTVEGRGGDLADDSVEVVSGEVGGAERCMECFAGVFPLVPPRFGFGEPGGDLLVDLGVDGRADGGGPQVEQVPGSAGPFLGLPDGLGGR